LIVNKKCCREKLILEKRLVFKKKAKNFVKRGCKWKNVEAYETNAQFAEFWSSLFAEAQVTYLALILLTLQTLTKLKTTFGRNLLYWN
jgi:hypothetical protein